MTWCGRLGVLLPLALQLLCGQDPQAPSGEAFLKTVSALPLPTPTPDSARSLQQAWDSKIDPQLRPSLASAPAEHQRSLGSSSDLIPVRIQAASLAQAASVKAAIRQQGGETIADFENTIWASIPPKAVASLASLPEVVSVSAERVDEPILPPVSHDARTMAAPGDGVHAAHLDLLHQRGFTGKGVKIGILDRGFGEYARLQRAGRVKAARAQRAFPLWHAVENSELHGTACAEILSVAAPGAELYLASFDGTPGRLVEAVNWLVSMGVNIINYSAGNVVNPNDGTDEISRFLNSTSQRYGVLWVVAAGNHAEQHWSGELGPSSGALEPDGQKGIAVTAFTDRLEIIVRWNDWGPNPRIPSSTLDIDAYLYERSGNELREVARSVERQNGGTALPVEHIKLAGKDLPGRQFLLVLRARHLTRRVRVHVFLDPGGAGKLFPSNPAGSILNPASADSALSVGAVDVLTGQLARYSSQGPTDDGRLKPDVAAPANTRSWTYEEQGRFPGTSAACAHVAAFAALLKEKNPAMTASALRSQIRLAVTPQGLRPPNALYGYGLIDGAAAIPHSRSTDGDATLQETVAAAEERSLSLPAEFGGSVSFKTLDLLRELANETRDGMTVRVTSDRGLYRIGDEARLELRASADCACLLFLRSPGGEYDLVAGASEALHLRPGEPLLFPAEGGPSLSVEGPAGIDELILVCAPHPASLESLLSRKDGDSLAVAVHSYTIATGR